MHLKINRVGIFLIIALASMFVCGCNNNSKTSNNYNKAQKEWKREKLDDKLVADFKADNIPRKNYNSYEVEYTSVPVKKIKDIFSYSHFFGFGPRHSVGKNSFKLISIEEIKRKPNLNNKLLLSQSVFDECINLSESNYQIISKQYHPSKTYINKTTHKMNLFNEGSYLKLTQDKEWIGKILSFNIDKKPLYYYGIGYII